MAWLYQSHGLRTEPSGAITTAALLEGKISLDVQSPCGPLGSGQGQEGDIVVVLSGRNIDEEVFTKYLKDVA
jgi:threonine dehydratase